MYYEIGSITPILQIRKPKPRELRNLPTISAGNQDFLAESILDIESD